MVDVIFDPIKTLVVHEVAGIQIDDLMRERITPGVTLPLFWCSGVVFSVAQAPPSEELIKDYMKGKVHWLEVHYADMKEYKPVLELNDENYGNKIKIRVIDTSFSQTHKDFVSWLNKNIRKK